MERLKKFYYKKLTGIDTELLESGQGGRWFHQLPVEKRETQPVEFLKLEVIDRDFPQVRKLLGLLERSIPNGEIKGYTRGGSYHNPDEARYIGRRRSYITIGLYHFSGYIREKVREILENQFSAQGIYNAVFV